MPSITDANKERVYQLLDEGKSYREVASEVGWSAASGKDKVARIKRQRDNPTSTDATESVPREQVRAEAAADAGLLKEVAGVAADEMTEDATNDFRRAYMERKAVEERVRVKRAELDDHRAQRELDTERRLEAMDSPKNAEERQEREFLRSELRDLREENHQAALRQKDSDHQADLHRREAEHTAKITTMTGQAKDAIDRAQAPSDSQQAIEVVDRVADRVLFDKDDLRELRRDVREGALMLVDVLRPIAERFTPPGSVSMPTSTSNDQGVQLPIEDIIEEAEAENSLLEAVEAAGWEEDKQAPAEGDQLVDEPEPIVPDVVEYPEADADVTRVKCPSCQHVQNVDLNALRARGEVFSRCSMFLCGTEFDMRRSMAEFQEQSPNGRGFPKTAFRSV